MDSFNLIKPRCLFLAFNIAPCAEYDVLVVELLIKIINVKPQELTCIHTDFSGLFYSPVVLQHLSEIRQDMTIF